MRPLAHLIIIQRGDLPRRYEDCPLRHCFVDESGVTTCEHLACPHCGIGPPVHMTDEHILYCEHCATRWTHPDFHAL